jgi:hypothetical protein
VDRPLRGEQVELVGWAPSWPLTPCTALVLAQPRGTLAPAYPLFTILNSAPLSFNFQATQKIQSLHYMCYTMTVSTYCQ